MKKNLLIIISICVACLCSQPASAFFKKAIAEPASDKHPARVIVIDPGHGGKDAGAVSASGIKEKTITLGVALKLQKLLVEKTNLGHTDQKRGRKHKP
jgi:N-acetylmuramoyl-L-alanine amidase